MSIANPYLSESKKDITLRRRAAIMSLCVAGILVVSKFVAWLMTDSESLMTSLMDSTFDMLASTVTLFGVIHAAVPADDQHRFGHGKIEALAAAGQAVFVLASSLYLLFESTHRLIDPQMVERTDIGFVVMALSIVLTVVLLSYQRYVISQTKSVAISADRMHYVGDLLMNVSVIASLALSSMTGWPYFDPLFAAAISLAMLNNARMIGMESVGILMDKELSAADRMKIEEIVKSHKDTRAIHDLRTRDSGQRVFIEFHLEVDGNLKLSRAHGITEEIELMIYKAFPKAEVLIHQEPAGIDDHRLDDNIGH